MNSIVGLSPAPLLVNSTVIVYLAHEFVSAVRDNRLPAINVWEAVRYMAMGIAAHRSALRDGETLDVPDWGDAPAAPGNARS